MSVNTDSLVPLKLFYILSHYNHKCKCILLGFYVIDKHKVVHNCEVEGKLYMIFSLFLHEKCGVQKHSALLSQYFVEPPFPAMTATSLLWYVSTSFAHLETGIVDLSSLQNSSSSVRLDGDVLAKDSQFSILDID